MPRISIKIENVKVNGAKLGAVTVDMSYTIEEIVESFKHFPEMMDIMTKTLKEMANENI